MARTPISHPIRTIAGAGLLSIALLVASVGSAGAIATNPAVSEVDGREALLNQWPADASTEFSAVQDTLAPVNGSAALLEQSGVEVTTD